MNRYNWQFYKTEKISNALNEFAMSVLFFELKRIYKHFAQNKDIINNRCVINHLLLDYSNFPNEQKELYKK